MNKQALKEYKELVQYRTWCWTSRLDWWNMKENSHEWKKATDYKYYKKHLNE